MTGKSQRVSTFRGATIDSTIAAMVDAKPSKRRVTDSAPPSCNLHFAVQNLLVRQNLQTKVS